MKRENLRIERTYFSFLLLFFFFLFCKRKSAWRKNLMRESLNFLVFFFSDLLIWTSISTFPPFAPFHLNLREKCLNKYTYISPPNFPSFLSNEINQPRSGRKLYVFSSAFLPPGFLTYTVVMLSGTLNWMEIKEE